MSKVFTLIFYISLSFVLLTQVILVLTNNSFKVEQNLSYAQLESEYETLLSSKKDLDSKLAFSTSIRKIEESALENGFHPIDKTLTVSTSNTVADNNL